MELNNSPPGLVWREACWLGESAHGGGGGDHVVVMVVVGVPGEQPAPHILAHLASKWFNFGMRSAKYRKHKLKLFLSTGDGFRRKRQLHISSLISLTNCLLLVCGLPTKQAQETQVKMIFVWRWWGFTRTGHPTFPAIYLTTKLINHGMRFAKYRTQVTFCCMKMMGQAQGEKVALNPPCHFAAKYKLIKLVNKKFRIKKGKRKFFFRWWWFGAKVWVPEELNNTAYPLLSRSKKLASFLMQKVRSRHLLKWNPQNTYCINYTLPVD
jgi:hypothetical protein